MGRAERRMARNSMNKADEREKWYSDGYENGFKKGLKYASEIFFYMTAYTIEYKMCLENRTDDLKYVMASVCNNIEAFKTNHLSPEDYDQIKEEMERKGVIFGKRYIWFEFKKSHRRKKEWTSRKDFYKNNGDSMG